MKSKKSTQTAVDDFMESMEGIERAEMPAFFYTRLQARLETAGAARKFGRNRFAKPVLSLVTLSLLVILNIAAIRYFEKTGVAQKNKSTSAIRQFAMDYDLDFTSLYQDKK